MKRNHAYWVEFCEYKFAEPKGIDVLAANKYEAYMTATYEEIPKRFGVTPYSAWVRSVTYNNGKHRVFHHFEGNPF